MSFKTADLCDHFSDVVQIAEEQMGDFGGIQAMTFHAHMQGFQTT